MIQVLTGLRSFLMFMNGFEPQCQVPPWNSQSGINYLGGVGGRALQNLNLSVHCGKKKHTCMVCIHESLQATNKSQIKSLMKKRWKLDKNNSVETLQVPSVVKKYHWNSGLKEYDKLNPSGRLFINLII